jgi:hypothetical protein
MVKCNVCAGTYEPILADGALYFHACPPLSVPELKDAIAKGSVKLSTVQQQQLDAAKALDSSNPVLVGELPRAELALAQLVVERPNKRDENIVGPGAPGQPAPQKAPGTGVTKI